MDAAGTLALLGGIALFVALFGGGVEVEKIKIPAVSKLFRLLSGIFGILLIIISVWIAVPTEKLIPKQVPDLKPTETKSSETKISPSTENGVIVLDNFNGPTFDNNKWDFNENSKNIKYVVNQSNGKVCFEFNSKDAEEFGIQGLPAKLYDVYEQDVDFVSGSDYFGLDISNTFDFYNFVMSNSSLVLIYARFGASSENVIPVPDVNCCSGTHKLAVKFPTSRQVDFYFDDKMVISLPAVEYPRVYGYDIRMPENAHLNTCVDEAKIRYR
jgi:hypothetical protein